MANNLPTRELWFSLLRHLFSATISRVLFLCLSASFVGIGQAEASTSIPVRGINPKFLTPQDANGTWVEFLKRFQGIVPQAPSLSGFAFKVRLEKIPRRGKVIQREGYLFGLWGDRGILRIQFPQRDKNATTSVLLLNGKEPKAWRFDTGDKQPRLLQNLDLFASLTEDVDYSAFDALMPFVHWKNVSYRGSTRVIGRLAHLFDLYPPEEIKAVRPSLRFVRVAVDHAYKETLRVEVFGNRNLVERKFSVISFKKVSSNENPYWIVKIIDLMDLNSREKTRLRIVIEEGEDIGRTFSTDQFSAENLAFPLDPFE